MARLTVSDEHEPPRPLHGRRGAFSPGGQVSLRLGEGTAAATAELNASSAPDPQLEKSVSAECAEYIADIEMQPAKAKQKGL
ncbi:hypothetical protein [Streptomyces sp. NPDC004685]